MAGTAEFSFVGTGAQKVVTEATTAAAAPAHTESPDEVIPLGHIGGQNGHGPVGADLFISDAFGPKGFGPNPHAFLPLQDGYINKWPGLPDAFSSIHHHTEQSGYTQINLALLSGSGIDLASLGSLEFTRIYNERGLAGFAEVLALFKKGPRVDFDIHDKKVGVSHEVKLTGEGELLGPIGLLTEEGRSHQGRKVQVVCVALAGGMPVALIRDVIPAPRDRTNPWSLYSGIGNADVRRMNNLNPWHPNSAANRVLMHFPPQNLKKK